jgi:hypothetical protein
LTPNVAKAVGLPMLDRMYKEYPRGEAAQALEKLAGEIRGADGLSSSPANIIAASSRA